MISTGQMSRITLVLAVVATVACAFPETEALIQTNGDTAVAEDFEQPDEEDEALVQEFYQSQDCHNMTSLQDKIACYKSLVESRQPTMMAMDNSPKKVVVNVGKNKANGGGKARPWHKMGLLSRKVKIHAANQELDYAQQAAKTERQAGAQSNIAATAQKVAVRAAKVTIQKQKVVDKVRQVLEKAEDALQVAKDNEAKASATAEEESERAAELQKSAKVMSQKAAMTEASKEARSVKEPIVVLKPKRDIHQGSVKGGGSSEMQAW